MAQRAIARHLGISRKTVKHFVTAPAFPQRVPGTGFRPKGTGKLDPYLPYVRSRWEAGVHKGSHLFDEIKARGYTGSASLLGQLLSSGERNFRLRPGRGAHANRAWKLCLDSTAFALDVLLFC